MSKYAESSVKWHYVPAFTLCERKGQPHCSFTDEEISYHSVQQECVYTANTTMSCVDLYAALVEQDVWGCDDTAYTKGAHKLVKVGFLSPSCRMKDDELIPLLQLPELDGHEVLHSDYVE